ncbi:MAG: Fic family protein [Gammaproteobacteria bacterium]|nr:Fic family protein [Gammaproteobacteria bacterium]
MTISGKSLKEHQEVVGHARAIDILYEAVYSGTSIDKSIIFNLHRAIQTEYILDIYKPIGGWKVEINGCRARHEIDGKVKAVYIEYAHPLDVDSLMQELIDYINEMDCTLITYENAAKVYSKVHSVFVSIHPFWDGNGRMARLIANIPLLKAGLVPLVIDSTRRLEYISALSAHQIAFQGELYIKGPENTALTTFCQSCYGTTIEIVEEGLMGLKRY